MTDSMPMSDQQGSQGAAKRCWIHSIPVDDVIPEDAAAVVAHLAQRNRMTGHAGYVATVNVDFLVNALSWIPGRVSNGPLHEVLRAADLVTADGLPVVWATRCLGAGVRGRVTGADLVPALAPVAAEAGLSVYLLGGSAGAATAAAARLRSLAPGLRIAGVDSPRLYAAPRSSGECAANAAAVAAINESGADILLLALGSPKQEAWFREHQSALRTPLTVGVGGTFEFLSGRIRRAPRWQQRCGMEWIFRLAQEPRRLCRRYLLGVLKFPWLLATAMLRRRRPQ
jgi:exopolysaccharide biosynthesis WecB/TagA/CpsF family protein